MRIRLALAALLIAAAPASAAPAPKQYTLPDVGLGAFQNALIPGSIADDRGVRLGGIGSDLYHGPLDPPGTYWAVTDRGPNGQIKVDGANRRTFPVPAFDPTILCVKLTGSTIQVLDAIPIRTAGGAPVSGLSNLPGLDETPYTWDAQTVLPLNPNGLDTEGLVRGLLGDFWLVDEYSPSILHLDRHGRVLRRYVPQGLALTGTDSPVSATLPGIYKARKGNRGFEAAALSLVGRQLYVALQSPLLVPDKKTGEASRTTRILRFDTWTQRVTGEWAYRFDAIADFDASAGGDPSAMKISALTWIGPDRLLVDERTDAVAKVYAVDVSKAPNLLGGPYDDPATSPSLEARDDPALALPKQLVVDLSRVPGVPGKIEGMALAGPGVLAVANDNDFGMRDGTGAFDANGRLIDTNIKSTITLVPLY